MIEAALLAAGRPLSADELVEPVRRARRIERRGGAGRARLAAPRLRDAGASSWLEVANGYRVQIRAAVAQPVSRLWQERPAKYSRALLETLALVAYRQPITRGEIEQIRGVAVNPNIIKTLLERDWIRVVGHRDVPGKPELLGTTREFLDYFGLKKLDDLPTLAQLKELEDLRVQLTLPGAEPRRLRGAAGPHGCRGAASPRFQAQLADAAADEDEDTEPPIAPSPRPQGLGRPRCRRRCELMRARRRRGRPPRKGQRRTGPDARQGMHRPRARAEAAVGGRRRLAPRSRALDSRGAAASQRRGAGSSARSSRPRDRITLDGRPVRLHAPAVEGIAGAAVSPLARRERSISRRRRRAPPST